MGKPQSAPATTLTPADLDRARTFWIKFVRQQHFSEDLRMLKSSVPLPKSNHLIRLTPYIDNMGVLRVGGRLARASLDPETAHPYILPRHSRFTTLVISEAHERTLHRGTQATLAFLRQSYWIIGGRAPVRTFILKCVRCTRYRGQRAQQLMGQLPLSAVTPSRPFLHSGVDYAGPLTIQTRRGRVARSYKGYVAVFVCFATSAIHLEAVSDYSTDGFLACYRRFTGRRGIRATLRSDCGTNFIGADQDLQRDKLAASKGRLGHLLANDGTRWLFNPPSAPHFGGKWEAGVESVKFHLRRVIGDSVSTFEELTTLLVQIETVLNSRPLCPLSDDSEDLQALTPGHFLIGSALTQVPTTDLSLEQIPLLRRWQLIQQKVSHFWARYARECIQRFQGISKWHHPSNQLKEGALVLLTDERYPPAKWPLARVISLHPGQDGLTRVVTIKLATTTLTRPISKLCIVPTDEQLQDLLGNNVAEGGRNVSKTL